MASNEDWWRNDQGRRGWSAGERDVRELGSHRDYGRGMLDDMRRYARGGVGWQDDRRDYGRSDYGHSDYRRGGSRDDDRGFFERAGDEMASWFGDDDAERRRRMDAARGDSGAQHHRGRGPRGYTRSDERIREDVNDRLTDDPYVDASDIDVTVSGCEVTLSGTVDDRRARRRAEDIAEAVSGVRYVQNNLRVRATTGSQSMSGSRTTTSYSAGDTTSPGTPGRMNAPATVQTADTDSVTRR